MDRLNAYLEYNHCTQVGELDSNDNMWAHCSWRVYNKQTGKLQNPPRDNAWLNKHYGAGDEAFFKDPQAST